MRSLALFNNKGGVGKTTLTFNLAHMFAEQGRRVLLVDCDPQCNLTSLALDDASLEELWRAPDGGDTIATCIEPVRRGKGDGLAPTLWDLADNLALLPGDIRLSRFESKLARDWSDLFSTDAEPGLHVATALERLVSKAGEEDGAELVLFDVGPSLGALNRAVLIASDAVVIPMAPDLVSLRGLENVGEALEEWRDEWEMMSIRVQQQARKRRVPAPHVPAHPMRAIGYVIQQQQMVGESPIKASQRWLARIPASFAENVLHRASQASSIRDDAWCLGVVRHYASLVPLAQAARKPLFGLTHADGIAGSQYQTVARARRDFDGLARAIAASLDAAV